MLYKQPNKNLTKYLIKQLILYLRIKTNHCDLSISLLTDGLSFLIFNKKKNYYSYYTLN